MNVAELIAELQKYPEDSQVEVKGNWDPEAALYVYLDVYPEGLQAVYVLEYGE